jgi:ABC-type amino acid transport substrate-binding protein
VFLANKADVVVYDKTILDYLNTGTDSDTVRVWGLPNTEEHYAIAIRPDLPQVKEQININILDFLSSSAWQDLRNQYLL